MNIVVTANTVPFIHGGADHHIAGLQEALQAAGHSVEMVRFPFKFAPDEDLFRLMDFCESQDYTCPNGKHVDRVISLQFPAYGVNHPNHVAWVMHQHRAVYDLWPEDPSAEQVNLRDKITEFDNRVLNKAGKVFANSAEVQARLMQYNGVTAEALYHPPHAYQHFYNRECQDYIFFPSRLESLKRQDLLIRAASHLQSPVKIIIGGLGGQHNHYQNLINQLQVNDTVRLIGGFSDAEKYAFYAHCLGVFFGPKEEDYGYVTLEAMLSAKPVITCTDSGGPLEFVVDQETGYVVEPEPEQIAAAIDKLYANKQRATEMGQLGLAAYQGHNISWHHVVERLLEPL